MLELIASAWAILVRAGIIYASAILLLAGFDISEHQGWPKSR
jgi:uncharacterized protein YfiM (DUF2279 family)